MAGPMAGMISTAEPPRWWWWASVVAVTVVLMVLPSYLRISQINGISKLFPLGLLAVSMGFMWGFAGMLSFGQTAFFGLGGYVYAVLALYSGHTGWPLAVAIVLPMLFALLLGYFMIYGRISDIYFSVVTLVVTLILEKAIRSTSGDQYTVLGVRLNGQNGIPTVPSLELPIEFKTELHAIFYLAAGLLVLVYVGLRLLLTTKFGRALVGIRENPRRMELLGYDVRRYRLGVFVLCSGIAALAGVLRAVWGNYVGPQMFDLNQAGQVVIWVIVGGRSTLLGPIVGAAGVQYLAAWLGTQAVGQISLILGLLLMMTVLLFSQGLVPSVALAFAYARSRLAGRKP
jgi:ABC-type branched-subunit amino acid transport system permease subunit